MQNTHSALRASELIAAAERWLVARGLDGSDVPELLSGLGPRLTAGGVAVDRAGCAVLTLHPQIVAREVAWYAEGDRTTTAYFTPALMEKAENRRGPYFDLVLNRVRYRRFPLRATGNEADTSLLERLGNEGYTEYFGFFHPTGGSGAISPYASRMGLVPCVVGSFATRRLGGFDDAEIDCFVAISESLALAAKSRANYDTASRLLELYVGRSCGSQVLDGRITRGESDRMSCGIWFCDLRRSSRLVSELPPDSYIELLNRYFDATAGAVMAGRSAEVHR
jgi:adenylate cyclase